MIIAVDFWVISVSITVIKIIFSGTIGAIFAFYAVHSSDSYANSIRWSRNGGFVEMVTLFRNSRAKLPVQSRTVMVLMILASLSTLFVSTLLGGLVSPADNGVHMGYHESSTEQLMSSDPMFFWTAFMEADHTMEETLISTLSDTRCNPNPIPKTRYTPRTYIYETACDESAAYFGKDPWVGLAHPPPPLKCKLIFAITPNFIWEPTTALVHFISSSVVLVTAPINYGNNSNYVVPRPQLGGFERIGCQPVFRPFQNRDLTFFPINGMINLPMTTATKCQYGSDESIAIAATYIDFAVNHLNDFDKVTASIFEDVSDMVLLQSMSAAIKNGTFLNPNNTPTMAMIAKINSDVDYLVCISRLLQGQSVVSLVCTYVATAMISVKPQSWDPVMREGLRRGPIQPPDDPFTPISQVEFTIFHLPRAAATKSAASYSAPHLLEATTDAAEYLASLGHNVFANKIGRTESEGLYILYDTVKLEDAFEVPTISLIVLLTVVVVCAFAWAISEAFYKTVYNGSLYKFVFREIQAKDKTKTTPMLMNCTHGPLAFEGNQVVLPDPDDHLEGTATSQAMHLLPIDKEPTQQNSIPLAPVLEEIHPHSPFLISRRLLAPTPIISPAIIANNTNSFYCSGTVTRPSPQSTNPTTSPPIPPRPSQPLQWSGQVSNPPTRRD
ncbi:hypothetical protein BGZ96_001627 [Linnemannia gamsii]|uniref:Uncharacterized protein n=1 Tax=Linnemannia gamsii TaxID=64522 RepID=A0ABQ7KBR4_9FUNG|nr:hypothetical protein BGZ96_001627 [Linnemannia gamsii]